MALNQHSTYNKNIYALFIKILFCAGIVLGILHTLCLFYIVLQHWTIIAHILQWNWSDEVKQDS